ncbi:MAG: type VI secretion system-associated protein TagF [Wenzhouxiangella sp.]|nr:MAG: type VI secretion system-associated protein TagF [Wenzhouxiangella sp.]
MTPSSGCYGKIPRLGDFITRFLAGSMVANWDEWLQDGISASRERLGETWIDYYMVSPVWNFAAGPGTLDQSTWLGVLIPSVDRVGRYFPFSVMVNAGDCPPITAMHRWQDWFDAAQELALDSLGDDFESDTLEVRLAELPLARRAKPVRERDESWVGLGQAARQYRLGQNITTRDVLGVLADDALAELIPAMSAWWTQGSDRIPASLLLAEGMPPAHGYTALLDGSFADSGWNFAGLIGNESRESLPDAPPVDDELD